MSASEKAALLPTLAASFVIGLVLGPRWDISVGALFLFLLASLLLAALSFSIRRSALPALALTALLLGLLRAGSVEPPGAELRPYQDLARTEVQGVVTDDPTGSDTFLTFRLSAERLRPDDDSHWREVSGDVRVTARAPAALSGSRDAPFIRYGDRLALTGRLEAPEHFGVFDFPAYLEAQGIGTVMRFPDAALIGEDDGSPFYRWLYSLRRDMARATSAVIPEPQASFGQAILLGIRDGLPDSLTEDFRRAGAAHLLAISGLHVGILLAISISTSEFLIGRRRQLYLALPLLAIWVYALISGASDSAIRAAIMGSVYVAAIAVGRPRSLIPALALAAALMAAIEPRVLSRVSFQLSFAAMTGIAIYYEVLSDRLTEWLRIGPEREEWWATALRGLIGAVGVTIAATMATAPLLIFYFERFSLVGMPSTLLSMPALPLSLAAHGATALVGLASETAALPLGWLAWILSGYITDVTSLFAGLPIASVETGELARGFVWAYYAAIAGWAVLLYSPIRWSRPRLPSQSNIWNVEIPWQFAALALVLALVVWTVALSRPDGMLKVAFADVGQGDMTVITTPSGRTIVVDGGPDPELAIPRSGRPDALLEAYPVAGRTQPSAQRPRFRPERSIAPVRRRADFWNSALNTKARTTRHGRGWPTPRKAQLLRARPGMRLSFEDGVEIQVLGPLDGLSGGAPVDMNDASVVIRVVYGKASFLLTGDVFRDGERWLLGSGQVLDSDVLKVAHHGSDTSSSARFLSAVSPRAAVISAGRDNRFGHPDPEVVERLEELMPASHIFKTYESGTITFETDGSTLRVNTER